MFAIYYLISHWSPVDPGAGWMLAAPFVLVIVCIRLRVAIRTFLTGSAFFDLIVLPSLALPSGTAFQTLPGIARVSLYLAAVWLLAGLLGSWRLPALVLPVNGVWGRRMAAAVAVICLGATWGWDALATMVARPASLQDAELAVGAVIVLGLYSLPLMDVASRGWGPVERSCSRTFGARPYPIDRI